MEIADIVKEYEQYGICTSAVMAMIAIESAFYTSKLAINANNVLGIKWKKGDKYEAYTGMTQEYDNGKLSTMLGLFRKYDSVEQCVIDGCQILCGDNYKSARKAKTPYLFLKGVKKGGWASDPNYAKSCNNIAKKYIQIDGVRGYFENMTLDSRGSRVKEIQEIMGLTPDGVFGMKTRSAIKKFQIENGLECDGVCGIKTYLALKEQKG